MLTEQVVKDMATAAGLGMMDWSVWKQVSGPVLVDAGWAGLRFYLALSGGDCYTAVLDVRASSHPSGLTGPELLVKNCRGGGKGAPDILGLAEGLATIAEWLRAEGPGVIARRQEAAEFAQNDAAALCGWLREVPR